MMSNNIIVIEKDGVYTFEVNGKKLDVTININDNTPRLTIDGKDIFVPYVVGEPLKIEKLYYALWVYQKEMVIEVGVVDDNLMLEIDLEAQADIGVNSFIIATVDYGAEFEYRTSDPSI